jgi:hypothetical protein
MRKQFYVLASLIGMSFLCSCDVESPAPATRVPQPYSHDPLAYKVKVKYNVNFTYTPKDPSEAPEYVIHEFQRRLEADGNGGNGYALAEGETPNLILDLTIGSDSSDNKSMQVRGYVSDGNFYTSTDNTYQDAAKMIDAVADTVDGFISRGWTGTR